jgi:hypothetical protein
LLVKCAARGLHATCGQLCSIGSHRRCRLSCNILYVLSARLSAPLRALHYTLTAFSPWRCAIMNRSHTRGKAIPKFTDQERFSCARAANCRSATSLERSLFEFKVYRKDESRHLMQALCLSTRPSGPTSSRSAAVRRAVRGGAGGDGPRASGGRTQVDALLQNYDGNTPPPPPVSLELGLPASSNIWRSLPWPGVATATSRA